MSTLLLSYARRLFKFSKRTIKTPDTRFYYCIDSWWRNRVLEMGAERAASEAATRKSWTRHLDIVVGQGWLVSRQDLDNRLGGRLEGLVALLDDDRKWQTEAVGVVVVGTSGWPKGEKRQWEPLSKASELMASLSLVWSSLWHISKTGASGLPY